MKKAVWASLMTLIMAVMPSMANEFSADIVTSLDAERRGKIYYKNVDVSRNEMMGMVHIAKRPHLYQLFETTKTYVVMDLGRMARENPMADIGTIADWMKRNNMRKTGQETLQGYQCDIYEGAMTMGTDQPPLPVKIWFSEKLAYALKTEAVMPPPMGKMTTWLENIKIEPQPAGLFEIPAGYTQAASVQEAMGLGGLMPGVAAGQGNGQQPSQEELDQIMKQMKEMMKQMPSQP